MVWYFYIAYFFAGVTFVSFIPHYVKGITGQRFPSPFAKPPGRGESTPLINVAWGLFNLLITCILLSLGEFNFGNNLATLAFSTGAVLVSFQLSYLYGKAFSSDLD